MINNCHMSNSSSYETFSISLISLMIVSTEDLLILLIACLPICITGLLVLPIPNYHNVLCALLSIYRFYTERRKYVGKGWCFYERFGEGKSRK